MLWWSVVVMLVGVAATVWAFTTDRDHGGLQLGALFGGSTLGLGGFIATLIGAVRVI
ncbi:hypothetical protein [Aeromicrobium sp. Sec7.5]|uniref:hypothetical protein n=1 Tax=Aeromicrobium sp. Sec7.5 TaxID=3121276 RepID=UPI002FE44712